MNAQLIFSVYDSAAEMYLDPFVAPTLEVALRGFRQVVNREGHQFNAFPADYTLFQVGEFDPHTGVLRANAPTNLGNGLTVLQATAQPLAVAQEAVNDG